MSRSTFKILLKLKTNLMKEDLVNISVSLRFNIDKLILQILFFLLREVHIEYHFKEINSRNKTEDANVSICSTSPRKCPPKVHLAGSSILQSKESNEGQRAYFMVMDENQ